MLNQNWQEDEHGCFKVQSTIAEKLVGYEALEGARGSVAD
jgi:hypothetical protein